MKRLSLLLALLLTLCTLCVSALTPSKPELTILFTHDLHSHLLPVKTEDGGQSGGYARLATVLAQEREAAGTAVVTLDGGDFSMGSLFQTIFATDAAELRILGTLGIDATTLGNHEFDFRRSGLTAMLEAADASGDPLPIIVQANYRPTDDTPDSHRLQQAMDAVEIVPATVLERDGLRIGVFGLMGEDADSNAPMSEMTFEPMADAAKRTVAQLQQQNCDYIICLSHGGTEDGAGEDVELAKAVPGIDVIVSGHTHETLTQPLQVGDTYIVSAGKYAENLGVLSLTRSEDRLVLCDYRLRPVDETVSDDPLVAAEVAAYQQLVSDHYLSDYSMTFDQVLAVSPFPFEDLGGDQADKALGDLIADAYLEAVRQADGGTLAETTIAITAAGVVRGGLAAGEITVSDAFDTLSLGVGADGTPGYPLVTCYLTGKELKDGFELDASVTPLMDAAQLYGSGLYWKYNTNRMIFNRVTDGGLILPDGSRGALEDDRLYRVVTGLYCCQMLSTVNGKSFGILSLAPRDAQGAFVTDYDSLILHDENGREIKEWYALASYLDSFPEENGVSVVPEQYRHPAGNKTVTADWNPVSLLENANRFTYLALGLLLLLATVITLVIRFVRRRRRRRAAKQGW